MPPSETPRKMPTYCREYFSPEALELCDEFLETGRVIFPVEDPAALEALRLRVVEAACQALDLPRPPDPGAFLDRIHELVTPETLNGFRLEVFTAFNRDPGTRPEYFRLARRALQVLVGNELTFQRRINLSIQLPGDDSSLLEAHADCWSGDSPFEVVLWVPLVDCYRTRSMYLALPEADARVQDSLGVLADSEEVYRALGDGAPFLEVPQGHAVIFSQNLIHGNRVNEEPLSRWSLNARFKALLSPYSDKRHAEFFEPITMRPATRLGLGYRFPGESD